MCGTSAQGNPDTYVAQVMNETIDPLSKQSRDRLGIFQLNLEVTFRKVDNSGTSGATCSSPFNTHTKCVFFFQDGDSRMNALRSRTEA